MLKLSCKDLRRSTKDSRVKTLLCRDRWKDRWTRRISWPEEEKLKWARIET